MKSTRKGFTLIELLIVVVIIGILAAIAIPKFANTKEKAYVAAMKSDLRNLMTAEEGYFADFQAYGSVAAVNFTSSYWRDRHGDPGASAGRWLHGERYAQPDPAYVRGDGWRRLGHRWCDYLHLI